MTAVCTGPGYGPAPVIDVLRKRSDFLRAARARRHGAPGFVLQARKRDHGEVPGPRTIRFGLTCSRKLGNAVIRNRAKRRLRALAVEMLPVTGHPGWDYVLVGRPGGTVSRDFGAMRRDLARALDQVHRPRQPRSTAEPAGRGPDAGAAVAVPSKTDAGDAKVDAQTAGAGHPRRA